ncbi:MAG: hypothetical protein ACRDLL_08585 [Solirubrobacterales bacterium]
MREAWTDERLDDLRQSMGQGFGRVDSDIRDLRGEMSTRFDAVDVRFRDLRGEMNARFDRVDARFDALQRTLLQLGGGIVVALIGLIATQL